MGKDGTGSYPHSALPEQESDPGSEFYDLSATIVDPEAGRRAAAAIAAARGLGQNESPTRESKNVSAALAAHERHLAEERRVATPPTPSPNFDLRVDALQEIEPARAPRPRQGSQVFAAEVSDQFDIPVSTGSRPSPLPRPRSNGLVLVLIAILAGTGGFVAFRLGASKLAATRTAPAAR
jgi:hypothetical protein